MSDPPAWLITAVLNEPWPSLPWHSQDWAVTRPWEEMRGQEAPVETVTVVTTAPTTPGTAHTAPALAHTPHRPSKPAFLTQNKAPARSVLVIMCGGVVAGPSPALPAAGSEHCSSSKSASSVVGKQLQQREQHPPGLVGGTGPLGPGKNQAGGVGNRSRPQRLFTVIKKPRHRAGPDAGNGESAQKMGQLVV